MNKRFKSILAIAMAIVSIQAFAATRTLGPGETLDWATSPVVKGDTLEASGGSIVNLSGKVECRIELSGEVQVSLAADALPRLYSKIIKKAEGGRLVFDGTVEIGGVNGAYVYADDGVIAFAASAPDARLVFAKSSYSVCQLLPQFWDFADRIDYNASSVVVPFEQIPDALLDEGVLTIPSCTSSGSGTHAIRLPRGDLLSENAKFKIPEKAILNFQPMTLLDTYGVSTINSSTVYYLTNDIVLAGGRLDIGALTPVTFLGDFTGTGAITVGASSTSGRDRRFQGSLDGLDAASTMTVEEYAEERKSGYDHTVRLSSGFPGTLTIQGSCPTNRIDVGVTDLKTTTTVTLEFGAIKSTGTVTPSGDKTFYGPMLQFNQRQRWHVGTLSGSISISPSQNYDGSEMAVDTVADNTDIWLRYGMKLTFGTVGKNVRVHYMASSKSIPNVIEITGSGTLAEVELRGTGNAVSLKNVSLDAVTGSGAIEVDGGVCRLGQVPASVSVDVKSGTVKFGSDADLATVLGARPAVWFDASNATSLEGTYNKKWLTRTGDFGGVVYTNVNPLVKFRRAGKDNQSCVAWTNGFPLVEKWFDTREEQTVNYLWQYRNYGYDSTLYTLVYPFLVPNGLNGKPYVSFGVHGTEDLDSPTCGTSGANSQEDYKKERRRIILMRGVGEGGAIRASAVITVFGSQNGGGRAILGGYGNYKDSKNKVYPNGRSDWPIGTTNSSCLCHFIRGGDDYELENSIFSSTLANIPDTWVNGTSVNPTNTPMSGGWDIISITNTATYFRSLGQGSDWTKSGGQNYAELIAFSNALSVSERQAVEEYLSGKWGLPLGSVAGGDVTVAAGAKVIGVLNQVAGAGEWMIPSGTPVTVPTDFIGTIGGAGEATSDHQVGVTTGFAGALSVTDTTLDFSYADGAFANAMVATDATLAFPTAVTVNLSFGAAVPAPGEYDLVSVGTLTGLDEITAVTSDCSKRLYEVRKVGNRLVLTVSNKGTTILVK